MKLLPSRDPDSDSSNSDDYKDYDEGDSVPMHGRLKVIGLGLFIAAGAFMVAYFVREPDYGPWTKVEAHDAAGIAVRVKGGAEQKHATHPNSPPSTFCNASMPVYREWGIRGPWNMTPEWMRKCHDWSTMPPMTWSPPPGMEPKRNWCWVRTKDQSCYPHDGDTNVPNWWWAQMRVMWQNAAPDPKEFFFEALEDWELCDRGELGAVWTNVGSGVAGPDTYTDDEKAAAVAWVNEHIEIYVVSLPTSSQRWQAMESRFVQLGIKGHRIPGVDLRAPNALQRAQDEGIVPKDYDYNVALQHARELMAYSEEGGILKLIDEMGIGTLGCAAAHLRAQRLAHDLAVKAKKSLVLIMEDDVWLYDDFAVKVRRILTNELPCDWDVFSLTTRCGNGKCVAPHVSRVQVDGNEPEARCHNSGNYGMFAMLYRVTSMMHINEILKKVCFNQTKPGCMPVDTAMASIADRIAYYAVPGSQQPGIAQEASSGSNRAAMNEQALTGSDRKAARIAHRKR